MYVWFILSFRNVCPFLVSDSNGNDEPEKGCSRKRKVRSSSNDGTGTEYAAKDLSIDSLSLETEKV